MPVRFHELMLHTHTQMYAARFARRYLLQHCSGETIKHPYSSLRAHESLIPFKTPIEYKENGAAVTSPAPCMACLDQNKAMAVEAHFIGPALPVKTGGAGLITANVACLDAVPHQEIMPCRLNPERCDWTVPAR